MAGAEIKNFDSPDERRPFEGKGHADVVQLSGHTVGRGVFEPGWKWSTNVKPIAGTDTCQVSHLGYCVSGQMRVLMDDGSSAVAGPGGPADGRRQAPPPCRAAPCYRRGLRRGYGARCRRWPARCAGKRLRA